LTIAAQLYTQFVSGRELLPSPIIPRDGGVSRFDVEDMPFTWCGYIWFIF